MTTAERLDLGRYRTIEVIGTGGFSTVYRAVDQHFDTPVAVKVLADNHAFDPEVRERFIAEMQLLRRLAGVPTVAVYDLGEAPSGQPFAVMALADSDLKARVGAMGPDPSRALSWSDLARVIDELTRCLGALHIQGIVHRDVKPSNLLVFGPSPDQADAAAVRPAPVGLLHPSESLRLADLGFAKDLRLRSGLTVGGGTPGFMPPEQAGPGRVDARADIYAATAVVVWLLWGRTPDKISETDIDDLVATRLGPGCSADGLRRGLANLRENRPPTMEDWRESLHQTLSPPLATVPRLPLVDAPIEPPPETPVVESSPGSPEAGIARQLVGVSLAALVGLGGFLVGRNLVGDDAGTAIEVSVQTDGLVTRRFDDGTVRIEVTGPDQLALGEVATFTAELDGASLVGWIGPDGSTNLDREVLSVRAARLGQAEVTLIAADPTTGEVVTVPARFTVVDGDGS